MPVRSDYPLRAVEAMHAPSRRIRSRTTTMSFWPLLILLVLLLIAAGAAVILFYLQTDATDDGGVSSRDGSSG